MIVAGERLLKDFANFCCPLGQTKWLETCELSTPTSPPLVKQDSMFYMGQALTVGCVVFLQGRWNAEKCSEKLLESVFEGVVTKESGRLRVINLTPTSRELALKLLDLAFDFGLKVKCKVFRHLTSKYPIY